MSDHGSYWEDVHAGKDPGGVSWWQDEDSVWVDLVERTGVDRHAHVVDVGSGSSTLPDALVARGFTDLTLVDLSPTALARTRERLRAHVPDLDSRLRTVVADVLELELRHPAAVWFDRAVLHFLTEPDDVAVYAATLRASLAPGGCAVIATFAPDGPEQCSGLPVRRYDAEGLVAALEATDWERVLVERRVHRTPWGSEQPFTVVILRSPAG
ncbi:class I SAM-dependent methyltransferase [Longivirga aurantiaca]|uniref:Class I SAM-dependent methyltransferase n=1 Tax=Longivirga aurantiaca TaxID=1837743 RepID=A0ABW1T078_9ACTN